MHLIKQLEEEFHGHKKAIEDSPETEHTRILYLRRIESLQLFVDEHFPKDDEEIKTLSTLKTLTVLHELRRQGEAALNEIKTPF